MTAQVIFAGCRELPRGSGDERAVGPALAAVGVELHWAAWDDPNVDFSAADLVVLRATWDYARRRDDFLAWCDSVPTLRNSAAVARWNTHKRYLLDLADAGVPIVPTELVRVGDSPRWPAGEFVVKPAVGAGSVGARRFGPRQHGPAAEHLAALHAEGREALIQPYQRDVDARGEIALVFFGGVYSHAFTKAAMLVAPDLDGSGLFVAEKLAAAEPGPDFRGLAEDTLDAAVALLGLTRADLLYARVDVVTGEDGAPAVLELELTEPSLGFAQADPAAPLRFASAVRGQLS
ncbi:ATP-grasp domain-containing protein [Saccharomonospora viridis]|uniref:ATP-grasp domain-containing protein n=2 Tax=Saccharomonospora viridis TaxID=1852 RepID=C7MSP3_SACVD|nr:hypothetical protein [Saccharomonospora viridis]ACU96641.1 hypothetical protein Svir_16060 [Saccharomonospora viridis DSM 43017]